MADHDTSTTRSPSLEAFTNLVRGSFDIPIWADLSPSSASLGLGPSSSGPREDPDVRLHASAHLFEGAGTFHVEALRVRTEGTQQVLDSRDGDSYDLEASLTRLQEIAGGSLTTLTLGTDEYVVYMYPHCD